MIDLHCHILPGIDDGPPTLDDTLALARAAVAAGTRTIVATSHVSPRYPNDVASIAAGVLAVNAGLRAAGIALDVRAGGEIAIAALETITADELTALHLGGGPWLLIESPFALVIEGIPPVLATLQAAGHRIVLAHPERCPGFHRRPDLLAALVRDDGVLTSVTAGALVGRFGRDVERFALAMARAGLIHNVASDAHDCLRRPPEIADPLARAGLGAHRELLVDAMPRAILDGSDLPEFPDTLLSAGGRKRRRWSTKEPFA